jgi:hypothetical protein
MNIPEGEDRDEPIPISERYRKSFIGTMTWSGLATLIAIGSIEEAYVTLPSTQMKYPTLILVSGFALAAVYWFVHFLRSERILKLASSQFAFDHSSSTLSEALNGFRNEVIAKTTVIAQMNAVKEPEFSQARLLLDSSFQLLIDFESHINTSLVHEYANNLLHAVKNSNEYLEENSVRGLEESTRHYRDYFTETAKKAQALIKEHSDNLLRWGPYSDHLVQSAAIAYEKIQQETQKIIDVAATLQVAAAEIDKRDKRLSFWLEWVPARAMLGIALIASAYNIWHGAVDGHQNNGPALPSEGGERENSRDQRRTLGPPSPPPARQIRERS